MPPAATTVRSFRDLRVWQAAMRLVEVVYELTIEFPQHETYGLAAQVRRAVVSVPSNIAEGHSRSYAGEYLHHIGIAQASLAEVQAQTEIASRLGYVNKVLMDSVDEQCESLARQLGALRAALRSRAQIPNPNPQIHV